jgi:hypothetical protein
MRVPVHGSIYKAFMRFRGQSHDALRTRQDSLPLGVGSRLNYLRVAVSGAYIFGILLSPRLWFGVGRTFPRLPIGNGLPGFILVTDCLPSVLLLAALILSLVSKRPSRYLLAVVALTAWLVLFDLTRLQPWVYQYVLMLAVLAFWQPRAGQEKAAGTILSASQLVVASLYFWSGTQKLNWSFGHEVFPGLLADAGIHLSAPYAAYLPVAAGVVAACEALLGVGLLVRRTRRASLLLALVMHFLVFLLLLAARRNSVVWPWNAAMMIVLVLLFWRSDHVLFWRNLWRWPGRDLLKHLPRVVFIICGLMPALSFFGWWDMYLSAALYSGNTPVGVARVSEQVRGRLPVKAQQQVFVTKRGELMLPFYEWSLAELNVPPYPEVRVYRQLARKLCAYAEDPQEIELIVKERPALMDGSYVVLRSDCADLLAR